MAVGRNGQDMRIKTLLGGGAAIVAASVTLALAGAGLAVVAVVLAGRPRREAAA